MMLQESEATYKKILDLEPRLVLCGVLAFYKMGHKESMRYKLKPCECKRRVVRRSELVKQVSHIEKYLFLRPLIKTVRNIDSCEYVDQHPVIRLLIEEFLLTLVVCVKFYLDEFENLGHEFLLVKFKCF